MPITTQQEKFSAQVTVDTPPNVAPVVPAFGIDLVATPKRVLSDRDRYLFTSAADALRDSISAPLAVNPAPAELLAQGVEATRVLLFTGEIDLDAVELVSADGVIVKRFQRGYVVFEVSDAWRAQFLQGEPKIANAVFRAPWKYKAGSYVSWTLQVQTFGGVAAGGGNPPPTVIGQPQNQTLAEGTAGSFFVPTASYFFDTGALTYVFELADGSPLPGVFSVGAFANGGNVITYNLPNGYLTANDIRIGALDGVNAAVYVYAQWRGVDNAPPQVLAPPAPRTFQSNANTSFTVSLTTVFADPGDTLTYVVTLNGAALPARYGASILAGVLTFTVDMAGYVGVDTIRIRATDSIGQTADAFFTITSTAASGVVNTSAPVYFPELATTVALIDVNAIAPGGDNWVIQRADGSALPGNYSVSIDGAGLATVTATFANNEIASTAIRYGSRLGVGAYSYVSSTWASRHNPPQATTLNLTPFNTSPLVVDLAGASDDPAVNRVVAGSASVTNGQVTLNGSSATITPNAGYTGPATLTYTLEAGVGGAQTVCTQTIQWRAYIAPLSVANVNASIASGVTWAGVNVSSLFAAGSAPLNIGSAQFVDPATDTLLGKSFSVTGLGSATISLTGAITTTFTPGVAGSLSGVRITIFDANGVRAASDATFSVTQTVTAPPPAGSIIYPTSSDGKAILQHGTPIYAWWGGQHRYNNRLLDYYTGFAGRTFLGGFAEVDSGKFNPITGEIVIAPGETYGNIEIRELQVEDGGALAVLEEGVQVVRLRLIPNTGTGGSANTCTLTGGGLAENGSSGNIKRYTVTLTAANAGQTNNARINGGANGGRVVVDYVGHIDGEANPREYNTRWISEMRRWKVLRRMDCEASNFSKVTEASQVNGENDFYIHGNSRPWSIPTTQNRGLLKAGYPPEWRFKEGMACNSGQGLHFNLPPLIGWRSMENEIYAGTYQNFPTGTAAFVQALIPNLATVENDMFTEYLALGRRIATAAVNYQWPDNQTLFFESHNEPWNSAFISAHYPTYAFGNAKFGQGRYEGIGWIMGIMAKALDQAFREIKPNQSRIWAVPGQTVMDNFQIQQCFSKINQYASQQGGRPASEFMWAVTSYFQGSVWESAGRSSGAGNPWGATSATAAGAAAAAAWAADQTVYLNTVRDWYVGSSPGGLNIQQIYNNHIRQRDVVWAAGGRGIMEYEGSCHEDDRGYSGTFPQWRTAMEALRDSDQGRDVVAALIAKMRTIVAVNPSITTGYRDPEMIISNYMWYGLTKNRTFPFGELGILEASTQPATGFARGYDDALSGAAGGPPPPPPPPTGPFDLDLATNDTPTKLTTAYGFSFPTGSWSVNLNWDGAGTNSLESTSANGTAGVNFRNTLLTDPNVVVRAETALIAAAGLPQNDTVFRLTNSAGHRLEIYRNPDGSLGLLAPYLAGQPEVTLFTTAGLNYADLALHRFILEYYAHPTLGTAALKRDDGAGNISTLASVTNVNTDPNGLAPTFTRFEIRYNNRLIDLIDQS